MEQLLRVLPRGPRTPAFPQFLISPLRAATNLGFESSDPLVASRPQVAPPWVHGLVRLMDEAIPVPGTRLRIGWDAIIGFVVPVVGDAVSALSHVTLLYYAFRARVPPVVMSRMVLNVAIDELWGSVPIVGDLFDAGFRANRKNLELLERCGGARQHTRWSDYVVFGAAISVVFGIVLLPVVLLGRWGGGLLSWLR